jgi:predicted ATPase/class 3 adenylate cyclase
MHPDRVFRDIATFLFSDIEGSTRLWEEQREAMSMALSRHDLLMRQAIEGSGGRVFKTVGDAFCAIFSSASAGAHAALAAQRALSNEVWPTSAPIKVRMALHAGEAEQRDDDFFGPALNRTARLLAAGHGGQILVSGTARAVIGDQTPEDARWRDLGEHRLRDLAAPERVSQLECLKIGGSFPPLKTLDSQPHNLPRPLSMFIGRERVLEHARELFCRGRLLSLVGAGGVGKTRLALQLAADVGEAFLGGLWWVELAAMSDPAVLASEVLATLGHRPEVGEGPLVKLASVLNNSGPTLLVLDNCEHLLDAVARMVEHLLAACPELKMVATSREALGLFGETTFRVPSLTVPERGGTLAEVVASESAMLFLERVRQVRPDFEPSESEAESIGSLCRRLDGIPFAIELAAARLRSMTLREVERRLDDRFRLLTGGSRTAVPRQQTLRALIDWSYHLLSEPEQEVLRRCSVFVGGWDLDAAEAVLTGPAVEAWQVADLLAALVDKSLAVFDDQDESGRYRLLETVRQFARERLLEAGEADAARAAHLAYFCSVVEAAEPELRGHTQKQWIQRLSKDHENLNAAMDWATGEMACLMPARLWVYLFLRGFLLENIERVKSALARLDPEPSLARAISEKALGYMLNASGRAREAMPVLLSAAEMLRMLDRPDELVAAELGLADSARQLDQPEESNLWLHSAIEGARRTGQRHREAMGMGRLAVNLMNYGDPEEALSMLTSALEAFRAIGDVGSVATALSNIGYLHFCLDRFAQAEAAFEESLAIYSDLEAPMKMAYSRLHLAAIDREEGRHERARQNLLHLLEVAEQATQTWFIPFLLEECADVLRIESEHHLAARIVGAAQAMREAIDEPRTPLDWRRFKPQNVQLRAALSAGAYDEEFRKGREIGTQAAIRLAASALRTIS